MHAMTRLLRVGRRRRDGQDGQSLVEFSLVVMPLFLVLVGIVQFGFVFNSYVTIANATREAAREGSIYLYDRTLTKAQNDAARNLVVKTTMLNSLNLLKTTAPQLTTSGTWIQSGDTFTNGDLTVSYYLPDTVEDSMPRTGQRLTVRVRYHQDIIVPLVGAFLPLDGGGRLVLPGEVTMVIN
jgi:Flp pilus assembly protein TadG